MQGIVASGEEAVSFVDEVLLQREVLVESSEATRQYESQWGIREVLDLHAGQKFEFLPSAALTVSTELKSVQLQSLEVVEVLSNCSVQHAGLEILHLFMVDLLGRNTPAAKIFKEKFGEDFSHFQVVLAVQMYAAGALMVGLNAFFVYFILLKGLQKGQAWQLQYLVCALIQIVIDVLVFETTECVWLNVMVPRTVQDEVAAAAAVLAMTAETAVSPQMLAQSGYFLNAPMHLFVSARVAKAYPQLLESLIVRSYSNHLPGQICRSWPHFQCATGVVSEVAVTSLTFVQTVWYGAALVAQVCLTIPFMYQRILLRFIQPMIFSALSVIWFSTINSPSSMAAMGVAMAICAIFYCWRRRAEKRGNRLRSVLPVAAEPVEPVEAMSLMVASTPVVADSPSDGEGNGVRNCADNSADDSADNSADNSAANSTGNSASDIGPTLSSNSLYSLDLLSSCSSWADDEDEDVVYSVGTEGFSDSVLSELVSSEGSSVQSEKSVICKNDRNGESNQPTEGGNNAVEATRLEGPEVNPANPSSGSEQSTSSHRCDESSDADALLDEP
jgi:hypothetical protein